MGTSGIAGRVEEKRAPSPVRGWPEMGRLFEMVGERFKKEDCDILFKVYDFK